MNTADSGPVTQTKNLMKDSIVKTKIHTVIPIKKTHSNNPRNFNNFTYIVKI